MNIKVFIEFCKFRHDMVCNQKYDNNLPYSKHLEFVEAQYHRFKHLLGSDLEILYQAHAGCWGHDLIEDARVTYNDLKDMVGVEVADIIYCCTEEKGRNRDERHSEKYYIELAQNKLAIFVKLCDIIANATYSVLTKSSMFKKHRLEHQKTIKHLWVLEFNPMFAYLDKLFILGNGTLEMAKGETEADGV
jgi:(p)ppGpp synthase/HD superfamily hydrolase